MGKLPTVLLLISLTYLFLATSCVSRKKLSYFQNLPNGDVTFNPPQTPYHLQAGDVIKVSYSGPDPSSLAPFGAESSTALSTGAGNLQMFLSGQSVSDSGFIYLPVLGQFVAQNKTVEEIETTIQRRLNAMVRNATAKVRLVSFKVSVLGEVRAPGTYYIYNEVCTLPEALGYAGDMTDNADRKKVNLIRRRQGVVTITTIDLTDAKVLGSPNFYLQPNDVLYATPIPQKAGRLNLPTVAIGLSGLTAVFVLLNILVR